MRYRLLHGIYRSSKQNIRSSRILRIDCNIVNNTSCLTTTLLVICVVVGGWKKSLVLSILIREPQDCQVTLSRHRPSGTSYYCV